MRILAGLGLMVLVAAACSSGSVTDTGGSGGTSSGGGGAATGGKAAQLCVPGSTQPCVGPGQCPGSQVCNPDGTAWGACDCGTTSSGGQPATGGGPTSGGQANGTGGASLGGSAGSSATGGAATGCAQWTGLGNCVTQWTAATPASVNMLIVLDKSASMNQSGLGSTGTKWDAMKSALSTTLSSSRTLINFGLYFFPAADVAQTCTGSPCCATPALGESLTVPIGPGSDTVPAILSALNATTPSGGTPTAAALARALDHYTTGDGRNLRGDKYVLLVTDGGPNCHTAAVPSCDATACTRNLDPDPNCNLATNCCGTAVLAINCLDDASVTSEIQALASAGIWTIVVGVPGSEPYAQYLNQFATAGGKPNLIGATSYYAVPSSAGTPGLADTLQTIIGNLVTLCELVVDPPPANPALFNLAVDCTAVTPSTSDGDGSWTLDTASGTVTLTGAVCDRIMTEGASRIDYLLGCPTLP